MIAGRIQMEMVAGIIGSVEIRQCHRVTRDRIKINHGAS